jgi:GxxExxY protein
MKIDELSNRVIGYAIEGNRQLGPGLLKSTYEQCLSHELKLHDLQLELQHPQPVECKGVRLAAVTIA